MLRRSLEPAGLIFLYGGGVNDTVEHWVEQGFEH